MDASKGAAHYDGSLFDQIKELQDLERNLIRGVLNFEHEMERMFEVMDSLISRVTETSD